MSRKVVILGGVGAIGSVATATLVKSEVFDEVIIADLNIDKANALATQLGISAVHVDVNDKVSLTQALSGANVVVNCVGPYFLFAKKIMEVAIELGMNYIDVNDDYDATVEVLELHDKAKEKGLSMVIGLGSSPGTSNLFSKYAADNLLDETESIEYYHIHGGEKEGPGVVGHRIHGMLMDIPVWMDGEMRYVKLFDPTGQDLSTEFDFPLIGSHKVYIYPHPEILTIPQHIKGVKTVLNRGSVLPHEYFELTLEVVKLGMIDEELVEVNGVLMHAFDFSRSWLLKQQQKMLKEMNFGEIRGCISTVIHGQKDGKNRSYQFDLVSAGGMGMGEGTGMPVAVGAIMLAKGLITEKGVLPPEACVDTVAFLNIIKKFLGINELGVDGPLRITMIDENGIRSPLTM
ncbi:MAG: saccharopine dehydrogenase NADP-binding domain-containing protein [Candidatus Heimdallarchaeota archaeon]|nr:saccharopine dehydrogenase NADP-binding domain-containing protein [Candidatus Heimdallarchaeota archaeon]